MSQINATRKPRVVDCDKARVTGFQITPATVAMLLVPTSRSMQATTAENDGKQRQATTVIDCRGQPAIMC